MAPPEQRPIEGWYWSKQLSKFIAPCPFCGRMMKSCYAERPRGRRCPCGAKMRSKAAYRAAPEPRLFRRRDLAGLHLATTIDLETENGCPVPAGSILLLQMTTDRGRLRGLYRGVRLSALVSVEELAFDPAGDPPPRDMRHHCVTRACP